MHFMIPPTIHRTMYEPKNASSSEPTNMPTTHDHDQNTRPVPRTALGRELVHGVVLLQRLEVLLKRAGTCRLHMGAQVLVILLDIVQQSPVAAIPHELLNKLLRVSTTPLMRYDALLVAVITTSGNRREVLLLALGDEISVQVDVLVHKGTVR